MMNLTEALAKYTLGEMELSEFPNLAFEQLKNGIESESLIILAGMNANSYYSEIEQYLNQTIQELDIKTYNSEDAAFILANYYIKKLKTGNQTAYKTIENIINNCWDNTDLVKNSMFYESINFEIIFSKWHEYYDTHEFTDWVRKTHKSYSFIKQEMDLDLSNLLLEWQDVFLNKKLESIFKSR